MDNQTAVPAEVGRSLANMNSDKTYTLGDFTTKQFVCAATNGLMATGIQINTRREPNDAPEPTSSVYLLVDPLEMRTA